MNDKIAPQLQTKAGDVKALEDLPTPSFSNWEKATKEELIAHVQELRLWCGQVVMELKDVRQKHDIGVIQQEEIDKIWSAINSLQQYHN